MALLNHAKNELSAKIVYYGPGLSGKTTNLEWIHKKLEPDKRGKLISLETKTDRTLFFDFLPVQIGEIQGYRLRFNVYTVPGQIFYNETRRMVLKGVDGVVFVADSQKEMANENLENLRNLAENLKSIGKSISEVPVVFQYNKRDLPNILSVQEMNRLLNPKTLPFFEAIAIHGEGVLTTLTRITRMVADHMKQSMFDRPEPRTPKPTTRKPVSAIREESLSAPVQRAVGALPNAHAEETPAFLQDAGQLTIATDAPEPAPAARAAKSYREPAMFLSPEGEKGSPPMDMNGSARVPDLVDEEIPDIGDPAGPAATHAEPQRNLRVLPAPAPKRPSPQPAEPAPAVASNVSWTDPSQIDLRIQTPTLDRPIPSSAIQVGAPEREDQNAIRIPVRIRLPESGEKITFQIVFRVEPRDPSH